MQRNSTLYCQERGKAGNRSGLLADLKNKHFSSSVNSQSTLVDASPEHSSILAEDLFLNMLQPKELSGACLVRGSVSEDPLGCGLHSLHLQSPAQLLRKEGLILLGS